jgi:hypothetical protein
MSSQVAVEPDETLTLGAPARQCVSTAEPSFAGTARLAVPIAGALAAAVVATAIAVHLASAGWARRVLAFHFPGVPAQPAAAGTVFLHNLHASLAIGGALLVAQSPHLVTRAARPGRIHRTLQRTCEALLVGGVAANVIVIGASFGAYGMKMVRAALPHGPFELAAYSLALALYLEGRRRPLSGRYTLAVVAVSTFALAVGALLETYVGL